MEQTWLSILPPILVLILAFLTHSIVISLGAGVIAGILIASKLDLAVAFSMLWVDTLTQVLDIEKLAIFAFLIFIGSIIALINHTGSAHKFSRIVIERLRSRRGTKFSSIALSFCFFIDDYLNSLTVGYIMHPLTDKFNIPRAKLAYLVDSLTAPLSIMVPVSSWVAMVLTNFMAAGISFDLADAPNVLANPLIVYFMAIPFIFYSLLTLSTILFIIGKDISYGPMYTQEQIAEKTGNLFGGKKPLIHKFTHEHGHATYYLSDFFVPIGLLFFFVLGGIALFGHSQIFYVLFSASLAALCIGFLVGLKHKTVHLSEVPTILYNGFDLMKSAIFIILIASIFGEVLKADLMTGQYLATLIGNSMPIQLFPVALYLLSMSIAIATGTSWGTVALMLPIAIPPLMALTHVIAPTNVASMPYLIPTIGAILSGAVAGDHISPISDTTIMAATSSGSYVVDHVKTQLWYAMPPLVFTAVAFILSGYLLPFGLLIGCIVPFGLSMIGCFAVLLLLNRYWKP